MKLKNDAYTDLILSQYDKVHFQFIGKFVAEDLPNMSALRTWERLKNKFQPMEGAPKTRLWKKFAKI